MKAIVNDIAGPPSVFRLIDVADPVPRDDEILIDVRAISIEGGDLISRRLAPPGAFPNIVGYQAAGVVIACGAAVTGFAEGDRVATFNAAGSHATQRAVPHRLAWKLPDAMSFDIGSTVPVTFGTAHEALVTFGEVQPGEVVLIQGATGGVGIAAVQIAKARGATVIAIASSAENLRRLGELGADHGIDRTQSGIAEAARALTNGIGVDLVIDMAGGAGFADLMKATRYGGRLVTVGAASGSFASADLMALTVGGLTLKGLMFGKDMASDRGRAIVSDYLATVGRGDMNMPIHARYPLADAAAAHAAMEDGQLFGRVLLIP